MRKPDIAPTLIEINSMEHPLMIDEIFGPILPVLTIQSIDEAISIVKQFEKPLAFIFSPTIMRTNKNA